MRKKITFLLFMLVSTYYFAQQESNYEVLNKQVEHFNNGDIDGLVNNVTEDYIFYYITSDSLIIECNGKEGFKRSMATYFESDYKTQSRISNHIELGNQIMFEEIVQFETKNGTQEAKSLATYGFRDGKICRTWYFIE